MLDRLHAIGAPVLPSRNIYNDQAIHELLLSGLRLALSEAT